MLTAQHWALKRQAANAIGEMSACLKRDFNPHVDKVLPVLVTAIPGFVWTGNTLYVYYILINQQAVTRLVELI